MNSLLDDMLLSYCSGSINNSISNNILIILYSYMNIFYSDLFSGQDLCCMLIRIVIFLRSFSPIQNEITN